MRLPTLKSFRLSECAETVFHKTNHLYYKLIMNRAFRGLANPIRAGWLFDARFCPGTFAAALDRKSDPHPLFDTQYYLKHSPGVSRHRLKPFEHFIWFGGRAGRIPLSVEAGDTEERARQALALDPGNLVAQALLLDVYLRENRLGEARQQLTMLLPLLQKQRPSLLQRHFGWEPNLLAVMLVQAFPYLSQLQDERLVAELCSVVLRQCGFLCRKALIYAIVKEENFGKNILEGFFSSYASVKPCMSVRDFCRERGYAYQEIWPARPITPPQLRFLVPPPPLEAERGDLTSYPLSLGILQDVIAYSNCNALHNAQTLIGDSYMHRRAPDAIFVDHINYTPLVIGVTGNHTAILDLPKKTPRRIDSGLQMFGAQTQNYGHWFLEFLPRMLVYDHDLCPPDFPIIVDQKIPPSALAALDLLNTKRRPIITLKPDEVFQFGRLGVASMPVFFPCDIARPPIYDTVWPADIFVELRRRILEALARQNMVFPTQKRRIFISRKNYASRQLINEDEVWKYFAAQGFEKIQPETLSFTEQVFLFHAAEIVVGSCSSAMTNTLFCPTGSQIIGFINETLSFNFNGYASFNCAGGAEMLFVRGQDVDADSGGHPYHRNYRVSLETVKQALQRAEKELATDSRKSA